LGTFCPQKNAKKAPPKRGFLFFAGTSKVLLLKAHAEIKNQDAEGPLPEAAIPSVDKLKIITKIEKQFLFI